MSDLINRKSVIKVKNCLHEYDKNIIIEDSPTGIRSGKDSGNFVIAIDRGMFTHDQLSEADLVVDKLNPEEIKTLFKTL